VVFMMQSDGLSTAEQWAQQLIKQVQDTQGEDQAQCVVAILKALRILQNLEDAAIEPGVLEKHGAFESLVQPEGDRIEALKALKPMAVAVADLIKKDFPAASSAANQQRFGLQRAHAQAQLQAAGGAPAPAPAPAGGLGGPAGDGRGAEFELFYC
jgi:hypothetical protein